MSSAGALDVEHLHALLGEDEEAAYYAGLTPPVARQDSVLWRSLHVCFFFTGGFTFIMGTLALFPSSTPLLATSAAALYTLGSCTFFGVDAMEFLVYTACPLRFNILLSAVGSLCYIAGSIGFFPAVAASTALVGNLGFFIGSALIFVSQCWKLLRIFLTGRVCLEDGSAVGVEAGAALGALFFLIGTYLTWLTSASYALVLFLWLAGSFFFTLGSLFLAFRHFVLKIS
jgi:hypothetical protein